MLAETTVKMQSCKQPPGSICQIPSGLSPHTIQIQPSHHTKLPYPESIHWSSQLALFTQTDSSSFVSQVEVFHIIATWSIPLKMPGVESSAWKQIHYRFIL